MINCKEDLLNTYIVNDRAELRKAYMDTCSKFDVPTYSRHSEDKHWLECFDGDMGIRIHGVSEYQSVDNGSKQLTLSDFKNQPAKVKVEYVACTESMGDIAKAMIDGESFYNAGGELIYKWDGGAFTDQYDDSFHVIGDFYRRIETPITWQQELRDYLNNCTHLSAEDDTLGEACDAPENESQQKWDDEFIEMCHLVTSLTQGDK